MILKVSHFVFSSENFEENSKILNQLGYHSIFTQKNIRNLIIKRPLFTSFNDFHDLCYFTSPNNVGVELLNWNSTISNESNFVPMFEKVDGNLLKYFRALTFNSFNFYEGKMDNFTNFCFLDKSNNSFKMNSLMTKTEDIKKSIEFWKILGFEVKSHEINDESGDERFVVLHLNSILPRTETFTLYLKQTSNINKNPHLDDKGISCLSFLSTDIQKEKELLLAHHAKVIEVGELMINNKLLNILFAVGPSGELIEIIDFKSDKNNVNV
ncbi:hypothetical protein J4444_00855 [Candidatus Woesearchaeota archaeon]|nr:hypothetical protein [Candidatus Woesearchaeota archaeon]